MQQILQKICFRNVLGSFSNKDIGTILCFLNSLNHAAAFYIVLKPTQLEVVNMMPVG